MSSFCQKALANSTDFNYAMGGLGDFQYKQQKTQNQRKDAEIESLQQRKAEIGALIDQARLNHKEAMLGQQGRYEHQNRQTIQHESTAAKFERELRMKSEECAKLRDRLRKKGHTAPAAPQRSASPGASHR